MCGVRKDQNDRNMQFVFQQEQTKQQQKQQQQQEEPQEETSQLILALWMADQHNNKQYDIMERARRQPPHVSFSLEPPMRYSDPQSPVSIEEARSRWYQRAELAGFNRTARNFLLDSITKNRQQQQQQQQQQSTQQVEELRGFERFQNLDRAKRKLLTVKCVLLAQKKGMRYEALATIARRCSEYAVEQAFVTGCQDYCQAYQPHMTYQPHMISMKINKKNNERGSAPGEKRVLRGEQISSRPHHEASVKRIRTY